MLKILCLKDVKKKNVFIQALLFHKQQITMRMHLFNLLASSIKKNVCILKLYAGRCQVKDSLKTDI